ncbi:hypothetical protein [Niabella ginsengisoli]|uniref:Uncharacterized protein n=1 Tax=Niabella ginsengisoli TaxID=522298 RepID=A0ABS9SHX6_9BACT|nr:hypothetical protein [Niabella ginsengisoli]MCH5597969.1 hypothetical protein [Niabella ginsengisoli]
MYDQATGNLLSAPISQMFWLMLNDPPLLYLPADKSNVPDIATTGAIQFQWTPRTTQASHTEYEFTLCELWDDGGDYYQQFLAANPFYTTTTNNTTFFTPMPNGCCCPTALMAGG